MNEKTDIIEHENAGPRGPVQVQPNEPSQQAITYLTILDKALTNPNTSMESIDKLFAAIDRVNAMVAKQAFDRAMAAAKAELPTTIYKNKEVDFRTSKGRTNYRYETLSEILKVCNPILAKHGLSVRFANQTLDDGRVIVSTILSHEGGHSIVTEAPPTRADDSGNKNQIQGVGSAITYMQRYSLKSALGIASSEDDDDGAMAGRSEEDIAARLPLEEDKVAELRAKVKAVGGNEKMLCAGIRNGASSLEEMVYGDLEKINKAIAMKAKRNEEAKAGGVQ